MSDARKGQHLHFEPLSGIAGDMTVAALVDAGVPREVVTGALQALRVPGLRARFEKRRRGAFVGTGFVVTWPGMKHDRAHEDHDHHDGRHPDHGHGHGHGEHHHRDYAEIRRLLKRAALDSAVKMLAGDIFGRIATVEGALHGVSVDRVTFHEVGAYDSIADVVGAAAAVAWLAPSMVTSLPPVLGTGRVATAHGIVSVPAPATAALLQGVPVRAEGVGELTTPTGAAILAAVVDEFRALPPVLLTGQGLGAGTRELGDRPNMLRVLLGQPLGAPLAPSAPHVLLLQSNIDDMSAQLVEPLMSALFRAGAVDAWATTIIMKKGRPALEVSALTDGAHQADVERAFFENSTTIGLRISGAARTTLPRAHARVRTRFGLVSVKVVSLGDEIRSAAPEFDDCKKLAARAGVPVRRVLAEAEAAAAQLAHGGLRTKARR